VSAAHDVAERVRFSIIDSIPRISEVLVHVDAESHERTNNELKRTRSHIKIESDVRTALMSHHSITGVSHINIHYLGGRVTVEASILVDLALRVRDVHAIAREARKLVESVHDVDIADIHLELEDS
jgi:divalent metal cation (Fe/Co/Zn/Cd) transporter